MAEVSQQIDKFAVYTKLMALGVSDLDAKILLDSIIAKKSCSWMNGDAISESTVAALNKFMIENSHPLVIKVDLVPTRGKYIWEVKALAPGQKNSAKI